MSAPLTYPGVYVEEISSGVRTIMSVSTAVTTFVGYTKRGVINKAQQITSFADFERKYGGLSKDSLVSYAVQQFFMNGGQSAIVVRIAQGASQAEVTLNSLSVDPGKSTPVMRVIAKEPGAWANGMTITVDYDTAYPDSTFNLNVLDLNAGRNESFPRLTMNPISRRNVESVINGSSNLIKVISNKNAFPNAYNQVSLRQGTSISGTGIDVNQLDENHRQIMITLNEEDGPQLITIYDGNPSNKPDDIGNTIRDRVKSLGFASNTYQQFKSYFNSTTNVLTLTSGETGVGSFVRVSNASDLDAARILKLGVASGGSEVDAAAPLRPAPGGTTSGSLETLPSFTSDRKALVTIDGDGPHEIAIFTASADSPPENLLDLSQALQKAIQGVKPDKPGSSAFMGTTSVVSGSFLKILSGSPDPNSIVTFENVRIISDMLAISYVSDAGLAVGSGGTILKRVNGDWIPQNNKGPSDLNAVYLKSSNEGYAVGNNATIFRWNGIDWTQEYLNQSIGFNAKLNDVAVTAAGDWFIVGDHGTILLKGNLGWEKVNLEAPNDTENNLNALFFSGVVGYAVGDKGTILHFANQNWEIESSNITSNLHDIAFKPGSTGNWYAVGEGGLILKKIASGWSQVPQGTHITEMNLNAIFFKNLDEGYIVGDSGIIVPWTNSAGFGLPAESHTSLNLQDISYVDDKWIAVGDHGTLQMLDANEWSTKPIVTDKSADVLKLSGSYAWSNIKAYTLGTGIAKSGQSGAVIGSDGNPPKASDYLGSEADKTGINALLDVDIFNILCLPGVTDTDFDPKATLSILSKAASFCEEHRAFLIIDCPDSWLTPDDALSHLTDFDSIRSKNAAMYFPRLQMPDILDENRLRTFPQCGVVAGIYARTDGNRGVWKAPAGQETLMTGVRSLDYRLTDKENGLLNPLGLNCLRIFPVVGPVVWGARTLQGADVLTSEWKYIPVRRTALFIEESLFRGLKWVVFEPNDEPLWSQIRLNVGAFMQDLFRKGAFQGQTAQEAYFVKCDKETTTQSDIDAGIVNVLVGFAPLKPAEFVVIKLQQMAGQTMT